MYILFDIGGTKIRFAISYDGKTFEEPSIVTTPKKFDEAISIFRKEINNLAVDKKIKAIAGGVRGVLNKDKSQLLSDTTLTDWVGKPLKEELENIYGVPVYIENDTALAGLGEAVFGAGKGYGIVAYITVSTGVGGVRLEDGIIDRSTVGFEPGKQIIDPDHTLCPDCPGVTLEKHVSGRWVEERFGKPAYEIIDNDIWHEISEFLAVGLHNIVVHWSPEIVILGGSMVVGKPGIAIIHVQEHLEALLSKTKYPYMPIIKKATLGDVGGLWGALEYLHQKI